MEEGRWVAISALQHYAYCPRQCALIHVEQVFDENIFTLRGRSVHERTHVDAHESRPGKRIERNLPVWSEGLGLTGRADVVEFGDDGTIRPVEYKAGSRRGKHGLGPDAIQLCGQALCLEEMFGVGIPNGDLYYAASRRRKEILFTEELRARTVKTAEAVRELLDDARVPSPVNDARCRHCSLKGCCLPEGVGLDRDDWAWLLKP